MSRFRVLGLITYLDESRLIKFEKLNTWPHKGLANSFDATYQLARFFTWLFFK